MVEELILGVVVGIGAAVHGAARHLLRARRVRAARRVLERSKVTDSNITRALIRLLGYEDPEAKELRGRLTSLRTRAHGVTHCPANQPQAEDQPLRR